MTGKGGSEGGFRIFPELRKVLGCYMPNFRSLGQSLHIDNFCKNDGEGRGGRVKILKAEKAVQFFFDLLDFTFLVVVTSLEDSQKCYIPFWNWQTILFTDLL